jgi:restriction endonuclease S subunit
LISHSFPLSTNQQWAKSNTNLFALRGSEVESRHRSLQNFGNRSYVVVDFGNRPEGFPAFGIEGGTWSSSNASITGGGTGGGGGVGYITVNNKTVSTISGNVTTSPDGDVFYFPGTNFSIGDSFALQLRTSLRQRRWRKQRRKQWQRQQRQKQWQRPQQ